MQVECNGTVENIRPSGDTVYAAVVPFGGKERLEISTKTVDLSKLPTDVYLRLKMNISFYTSGSGKETRQRARVDTLTFTKTNVPVNSDSLFGAAPAAPVEAK